MSGNASADAREEPDPEPDEYDAMIEALDVGIDEARRKVDSGRMRDVDKEKARVKWVRALGYCINVRRQLENDKQLSELSEKVDQLLEDREDGP